MLDALLSALSAPGDYTRGLLAGRVGDRVSGQELLRELGVDVGDGLGGALAGVAADVATDPLTLVGGAIGRIGGRAVGKGLERLAAGVGPNYSTKFDDVIDMVNRAPRPQHGRDAVIANLDAINTANPRVWSELPPGSSMLGAGQEGTAFRTPAGQAIRVELPSMTEPFTDAIRPGRPTAGPVLQASRTVDYPAVAGEYGVQTSRGNPSHMVRVEQTPLAAMPQEGYWLERGGQMGRTRLGDLRAEAGANGLDFWDRHPGNVGLVGGSPKIIDPGAVTPVPGYAGGFQDVRRAVESNPLLQAIFQGDVRRALEAGTAGPRYARPLANYGTAGGAAAGAF